MSNKKFEPLFINTFYSSPVPMTIATKNDGVWVETNDAFCNVMEYTRDELIGHNSLEFNLITPESRADILQKLHRSGPHHDIEIKAQSKSGRVLYLLTFFMEIEVEGEKFELAVMQDITERKRMEEELRKSEIKFKTFYELAPVGISILDKERKIIDANPALEKIIRVNKTGLLAGSFEGRKFLRKDGTPMPLAELASMRAVNENRAVFDVETGIMTEDGEMIWTNVNAAPLQLPDVGAMVVTQDITKRKLAEEALLESGKQLKLSNAELVDANKELEAFSYSLSHDLRNPLQKIISLNEVLFMYYSDCLDDDGQKCLNGIAEATTKITQVTNDVIALAQFSKKEMIFQSFDLSRMVGEYLQSLKETQPNRKVEFLIQDGLCVNADIRLLRLATENLLKNAWKFTVRSPVAKIEFGADCKDNKTIYYVRDNGVGFDSRFAERLFEPFMRLHSDREFKGTGVGLSIVKRAICRHGGSVWATGELGKGATFYFTLGEEMLNHECC